MHAIVVAVVTLSTFHGILGLMSVCLGVAASIQAEVWLAHSISPIWSGAFFTITGILGFVCAKRRTAYMIMCFTAFSIVSLVTAVVSIQLLRMGLVNQTTDGSIYQKEHKDKLILVAMGAAGVECLICLVSSLVSCRLARAAKKAMERKRDGTFHVQDDGEGCDNNNRCAVYTVEKGYHNPNMYGVQEETSLDQEQMTIALTNEDNDHQVTMHDGTNTELLISQVEIGHGNNTPGENCRTDDKTSEQTSETNGQVILENSAINKVRVEIEDHTDDEEPSVRTPNMLFLAGGVNQNKNCLTIVDNLATGKH